MNADYDDHSQRNRELLSSLYYCPLCHQEIGLGVGWIATFLHRPKMMISFPLHVQRLGA